MTLKDIHGDTGSRGIQVEVRSYVADQLSSWVSCCHRSAVVSQWVSMQEGCTYGTPTIERSTNSVAWFTVC